jgi:hypothetical protein
MGKLSSRREMNESFLDLLDRTSGLNVLTALPWLLEALRLILSLARLDLT